MCSELLNAAGIYGHNCKTWVEAVSIHLIYCCLKVLTLVTFIQDKQCGLDMGFREFCEMDNLSSVMSQIPPMDYDLVFG